jgi:cytidylate kinase
MYRAITWKILRAGISLENKRDMIALAEQAEIQLKNGRNGLNVWIDGEDVTQEIRTPIVTKHVSQVAQIAEIRKVLVDKQQKIAASKGVVMDGRDIGSTVLPDAEVKIFLTASVKIRADRRFKEMLAAGQTGITLERLEQEIADRDRMDEQRETSPLVKASDAVLLDTSGLTIPEVVDRILSLCRQYTSGRSMP